MTAQGVLTQTAFSFSGLKTISFAGGNDKSQTDNSFENIMESKQDSSRVSRDNPKDSVFAKKANRMQGKMKECFTGKGRVKEISEPTALNRDIPDDITEAVASMMIAVKETICNMLSVSSEELDKTMDELGLTDASLLSREGLQKLFLSVNQVEEPTEFLTNETLLDDFADLMQAVEQTISQTGLDRETCKEVLESSLPLPLEEVNETEQPFLKEVAKPEEEAETKTDSQEEIPADAIPAKMQAKTRETESESTGKETGNNTVKAQKRGDVKILSDKEDMTLKESFIDSMTKAVNGNEGEMITEAATELRQIANQVLEQIKIVIRPEQTNMELQLNPEHLGRVHLTITEKEGMMTASFSTQTQVAKEAIESQMTALRDSLQEQGIKVQVIEVTVSEFGFEQNREAKGNQNGEEKKKRRNDMNVAATKEEAPKMEDFMRISDSNVDYSA